MSEIKYRLSMMRVDPASRIVFAVVVFGAVLIVIAAASAVSEGTTDPEDDALAAATLADQLVPRGDKPPPPLERDQEARAEGLDQPSPVPISEQRLWKEPGNRILQVRKNQRVKLFDAPGGERVAKVNHLTGFGSPRTMSVLNRQGEWIEVASPEASDNRPLWVKASFKDFRFATTPFTVKVDLGNRMVTLERDGSRVDTFPVTIGAAGSATPPGRFGVTDVITAGLNPVYGCCAIALSAHQPNLPEGWIGGDRVAIHGTSGPVGGAESNGCVRATNDKAGMLAEMVPLGTPVIIKL